MNNTDDLNCNPDNEQEYKDKFENYIQVRNLNSVFHYKKICLNKY